MILKGISDIQTEHHNSAHLRVSAIRIEYLLCKEKLVIHNFFQNR